MGSISTSREASEAIVTRLVGDEEAADKFRDRIVMDVQHSSRAPSYRRVQRAVNIALLDTARTFVPGSKLGIAAFFRGGADEFFLREASFSARLGVTNGLRGARTTEQLLAQHADTTGPIPYVAAQSAVRSSMHVVAQLAAHDMYAEADTLAAWEGGTPGIDADSKTLLVRNARDLLTNRALQEPAPFDVEQFSLDGSGENMRVVTNVGVRGGRMPDHCRAYAAQTEAGTPAVSRFLEVIGEATVDTVLMDRLPIAGGPHDTN